MQASPPLAAAELADALSRVEPEVLPTSELVDWASDALLAGERLPDLLAELVHLGWDAAVAEAAIEAARVQTRGLRGIVTRADVVRLGAGSRPSPLSVLCRGVGLLGFAGGLRTALARATRLRRVTRPRTPAVTAV